MCENALNSIFHGDLCFLQYFVHMGEAVVRNPSLQVEACNIKQGFRLMNLQFNSIPAQ